MEQYYMNLVIHYLTLQMSIVVTLIIFNQNLIQIFGKIIIVADKMRKTRDGTLMIVIGFAQNGWAIAVDC